MVYISDQTIDRYIKEDVPYIDLTTVMLNIGGEKGRIAFECRDEAVICGNEEAERIMEKLRIRVIRRLPSGSRVAPRTIVLEAEGDAASLHTAWKVSQNILEYTSGIATRTARILDKARQSNPDIELVGTRKVFPGTKELAVKAVIAGGGMPHRLGLSETVLFFEQHMNFVGGLTGLVNRIDSLKRKSPEKKIIVEVKSADEAEIVCQAGADGIQLDKVPDYLIPEAVTKIKSINPGIIILAAGGINENNAQLYAIPGINAIVTSAIYYGPPVDFGVQIVRA